MAIDLNQLLAGYKPENYGYSYQNDGARPTGWYSQDSLNSDSPVASNPYGSGSPFEKYLSDQGVGMWDPGNPTYGRVGLTNQQAFNGLYPGAQILGTGSSVNGSDPSLAGTQFFTSPNGATPNENFAAANVWGKDMGDNTGINKVLSTVGPMIPLLAAGGMGAFAGLGGAAGAGAGAGADVGGGVDMFGNVIGGGNFAGGTIAASDGLAGYGAAGADVGGGVDMYGNVIGGGNFTGGSIAASDGLSGFGAGANSAPWDETGGLNPTPNGYTPYTPGGQSVADYLSEISNTNFAQSSLWDTIKNLPTGNNSLLKALKGDGTQSDYLDLLGKGGSALLKMYGSNQKANTLQDLINQQRADRQPAMDAYNSALKNPDSWYQSAPAMGAADAASRALSVHGNPAANPGLMAQLAAHQLGGYNQHLASLAGPAFGGQSTQAQLALQQADAAEGVYGGAGFGIGALTAKTGMDVEGLLKKYAEVQADGTIKLNMGRGPV